MQREIHSTSVHKGLNLPYLVELVRFDQRWTSFL